MVDTVALQQETHGFKSMLEAFCVGFPYSPHVCLGYLKVFQLSQRNAGVGLTVY